MFPKRILEAQIYEVKTFRNFFIKHVGSSREVLVIGPFVRFLRKGFNSAPCVLALWALYKAQEEQAKFLRAGLVSVNSAQTRNLLRMIEYYPSLISFPW